MTLPQFEDVMRCFIYWNQVFQKHDVHKSGHIDSSELDKAIENSLGKQHIFS